jgi:hypothetical protein
MGKLPARDSGKRIRLTPHFFQNVAGKNGAFRWWFRVKSGQRTTAIYH